MISSVQIRPERPCVLVTGVAGYIGSNTALAFLDAGWRVIGVDDLSAGRRASVPSGVEFIELDCGDPSLALRLSGQRIDAAVHFAGMIDVEESVTRPLAYYRANFGVLMRLLETLSALSVNRIVFSSTAAVYGNQGSAPLSERSSLEPISPYGRSKLAAEWLLKDVSAATGLRHVTLRYFNVAGADPHGRAGPRASARHLIKVAAEAAVGRRAALTILGDDYPTPDGTGVRDYIHVTDLASAHVAAVEYLIAGGETVTLNCGYGRGFSVREVIDRALALAPVPFDVVVGPRRQGDSASVIADPSSLRATLAWEPRHADLDAIVQSSIEWELASQSRATDNPVVTDETLSELSGQCRASA